MCVVWGHDRSPAELREIIAAERAADPFLVWRSRDSGAAPAPTLTPTQRKVLIALCRPVQSGTAVMPASNRAIAEEVFLSVDAVKAPLRALFERCGLSELPQNEKRSRLVATALVSGLVDPREFGAATATAHPPPL